jgi:hypothetical protein
MARRLNLVEIWEPGGAAHSKNNTFEVLATQPAGAPGVGANDGLWEGRIWYNSTEKQGYYYNGSASIPFPAASADKEPVLVASALGVNVPNLAAVTVIDGVTLPDGARVLLKDQTTGSENGIYRYDLATTTLVRAYDMDSGTEANGAAVWVLSGATNSDSLQFQTIDSVTIGTTAMVWVRQNASYTADNKTLEVSANQFKANVYTALTGAIAAGVATNFAHSLANGDTGIVIDYEVTESATGRVVDVDVTYGDTNIVVTPVAAIAANPADYRITATRIA